MTRGRGLPISPKSVLELQQWGIKPYEKHFGARTIALLLLTVGKLHTWEALDGYALLILTNTISHWTYCAWIFKAEVEFCLALN